MTEVLEPLVVRRSAVRTWLAALAAIPAIVIGVDVLWRQRIVSFLSARIFPDDPQALEPRDTIWAVALVVVGLAVVIWGLKELFDPAPVIRTDEEGVHIRMRGPFRDPVMLPWTTIHDVDSGTLEDDEDPHEVLVIEVEEPSLLPLNPWAGRRFDKRTLALYSDDWDTSADDVAKILAAQAIRAARAAPPPL